MRRPRYKRVLLCDLLIASLSVKYALSNMCGMGTLQRAKGAQRTDAMFMDRPEERRQSLVKRCKGATTSVLFGKCYISHYYTTRSSRQVAQSSIPWPESIGRIPPDQSLGAQSPKINPANPSNSLTPNTRYTVSSAPIHRFTLERHTSTP